MLPHSDSKKVPKIECECLQHNLKRQKVLQKLPMLKVLLLHGGTPNIICLKPYFFNHFSISMGVTRYTI